MLVALVAVAACAEPPLMTRLAPDNLQKDVACRRLPCSGDPITTPGGPVVWRFFGSVNDPGEYEAPNDPSPGANGLWLGATVTPATCFNDQTRAIVDADQDWLDDRCEEEIARGFAPRWGMSDADDCPGGEPAWAAKYFPNNQIVRVMFMPAYYRDCGADGHNGDSEYVIVDIRFNPTTQHWEFNREYLT